MTDLVISKKIDIISRKLQNISVNNFSAEQLNQIEKMLIIDKAKEKVSAEVKKNGIDLEVLKNKFVKSQGSEATKQLYNLSISYLQNYLKEKGLHLLDFAEPENIDDFITYIADEKNPSTAVSYIRCISSFFSKLERWQHISRNYFKGAKLPKKKRTRLLKVITEKEYGSLIDTLKAEVSSQAVYRGSHKRKTEILSKWLVIFELLHATGLRVSAVQTITIGQEGLLSYYSKGKNGSAKVSRELAKDLRTLDLSQITKQSIQKALQKACKNADIPIYNPHSLRHNFAIREYKENKDIHKLCKLLNHSSISTTEKYLAGLGLLNE